MKKAKIFFMAGCVMIIAAIAFVAYALNHPEASFPWSNSVTYTIYVLYLFVVILLFVFGSIFRKKQEES